MRCGLFSTQDAHLVNDVTMLSGGAKLKSPLDGFKMCGTMGGNIGAHHSGWRGECKGDLTRRDLGCGIQE